MITSRRIVEDDLPLLQASIDKDEHHSGDDINFWTNPYCLVNLYEDDDGPVLFLRGSVLREGIARLDIQFVNNDDGKRNLRCMSIGFALMEEMLKKHNFIGVVFESKSPLLKKYCQKRLGFEETTVDNWLVKVL